MTYDLSNPLHRKQFETRVQSLLQRQASIVELTDASQRSPSQNKYLHVIIRILALETGVSEAYAKDKYFKEMANPGLFVRSVVDPITYETHTCLLSSSSLTVEQMSIAIDNFRRWSAQQGYYLPDATFDAEGTAHIAPQDEEAYRQAVIETERNRSYIT